MSTYIVTTQVNGTFSVPSGQIDSAQTSLKLIGRGSAGYGQAIADNTIKQLSNFADTNAPLTPLFGQLWYDYNNKVLRIYEPETATHPARWSYIPSYLTTSKALLRDVSTSPILDNTISLGTPILRFTEINAVLFKGTAVQAQYADVAERYEIDIPGESGDLVEIGGDKEIRKSSGPLSTDVVGVISANPAIKMNSDAGDDSTHPYVALVGRVPVKVLGSVKKGQRLVASNIPGVAMAISLVPNLSMFAVIGRALSDKVGDGVGLIEVMLGVK